MGWVREDERFRKLSWSNSSFMFVRWFNLHSCTISFPKVQPRSISIIYQCILSTVVVPSEATWLFFSRTPGLESNALHVWDLNQICLVSINWTSYAHVFWVLLSNLSNSGTVRHAMRHKSRHDKSYKDMQKASQFSQKKEKHSIHTGILAPSLYALQYAVHVI